MSFTPPQCNQVYLIPRPRLFGRQMIQYTLGVGGLTEQVKAMDGQRQTLLMYAARCTDFAVFKQSTKLVQDYLSGDEALDQFKGRDSENRTLLHHAADAGSDQVLAEVIETHSRIT